MEKIIELKNNTQITFLDNIFIVKNDKYKFIIKYDKITNIYNIKFYYGISYYESNFYYDKNKYIFLFNNNGNIITNNNIIKFKTIYYPYSLLIDTNNNNILFCNCQITLLNCGKIIYNTIIIKNNIEIIYFNNNNYEYNESQNNYTNVSDI